MGKNKSSIGIFVAYFVFVVLLFLYSYTQVDLNLTLSRVSFFQSIQKAFQYIGYYQRPFSAIVYIGIITALFLLYYKILVLVYKKKLNRKYIWGLIYGTVLVLIYSYPGAFSYDFFNYMFTAKTVLVYHKNPYEVTPLMFAGIDPWVNFMRWTHLSSAYAPLWIVLTLIPYALGFGYFLLIMINLKIFIALFYLLSCIVVEKILAVERPNESTFGLAVFALNPLIIVETLVSSHNDIVLSAFLLVSFWYLLYQDKVNALFWLSLSIASKLMTITVLPLYALKNNRGLMLMAMLFGLLVVVVKREFLPWYFVWIMPFIALMPHRKALLASSSILSLGLLLSYVPYLYIGSYTPQVQFVKTSIIIVSSIIAIVLFFVSSVFYRRSNYLGDNNIRI